MKRTLLGAAILLIGCRSQEGGPGPATPASNAPAAPVAAASATAAAPLTADSSASVGSTKVWSFDTDAPGAPPKGFSFGRTGDGREGKWIVRAEADAPTGPNVLTQTDADASDYRFPIAFADAPALRDLELSVRCKPVSGSIDQACGLAFRLSDSNNYYVTRANALENNVRLYFVKDGKRQQIAGWSGKVTSGAWHEYRVVARGDHFEVY